MGDSQSFIVGDPDPTLYSMTDGIVRPDRKLPLEDAMKLATGDPIWANRGKAIQAYASLEQALCSVLAGVGDISKEVASTIFFKITSTGARNSIIEKLINLKCGTTYNLFWNSFLKSMRPVDIKRNEIVHWNVMTHVAFNTQMMMMVGLALRPPGLQKMDSSTPKVQSCDLILFIQKCGVFEQLCNMFFLLVMQKLNGDDAKSWHDIFQQPLIYPLPADHLLSRTQSAPDNQLQPSPP